MKAMLAFVAVVVCLAAPQFVSKVSAQQGTAMTNSTSGGKLDVKLEPSCTDTNCNFKVTFLQPHSQTIQVHIDYDFTILNNGTQIFSAAKSTNQQILHTAEGSVTIPYKFDKGGDYQAKVTVYGVVFVPINPESAQFPISVGPEFPAGGVVAAAGVVVFAIVASRMLKRRNSCPI